MNEVDLLKIKLKEKDDHIKNLVEETFEFEECIGKYEKYIQELSSKIRQKEKIIDDFKVNFEMIMDQAKEEMNSIFQNKLREFEINVQRHYENEIETRDKRITELEMEVCENISLNLILKQKMTKAARHNEICQVRNQDSKDFSLTCCSKSNALCVRMHTKSK